MQTTEVSFWNGCTFATLEHGLCTRRIIWFDGGLKLVWLGDCAGIQGRAESRSGGVSVPHKAFFVRSGRSERVLARL